MAASTPSGTEINSATASAATPSISVVCSLSNTSGATSVLKYTDMPRLPCTSLPSQSAYCTTIGPVEAVGMAHHLDVGLARALAGQRQRRVPRQEHQHVREERHRQRDEQRHAEALEHVEQHGNLRLPARAGWRAGHFQLISQKRTSSSEYGLKFTSLLAT